MRFLRILLVILALAAMTIIVFSLIGFFRNFGKPNVAINTSSTSVIKELRELKRLETASFTIEKVIDAGTTGNRFQEFLYGDRILLIAHGEVIAGFDLSTLSEDAISVEGQTAKLTLPAPAILVTNLRNDKTRVYDRRQGLLTKGDKDLEAQARQAAEEELTKAACEGDVLEEASNNARKQLTALLKALGFTTVVITIPSASC